MDLFVLRDSKRAQRSSNQTRDPEQSSSDDISLAQVFRYLACLDNWLAVRAYFPNDDLRTEMECTGTYQLRIKVEFMDSLRIRNIFISVALQTLLGY